MHGANEIGGRWLDRTVGLAKGEIEGLVSVVVALHDVGKLSKDWQDAAWEYETGKTGRVRTVPIAHTTTGPGEKGPKLPPHAVESAFACSPLLEGRGSAAWALATAIARHHSATACQAHRFELIPDARQFVQSLLGAGNSVRLRGGLSPLELDEFKDAIGGVLDEDIRCWWPVYAYLVRRLRLADQAGTKTGVEAGGSTT
jgi:hypothetical protein